MRNIEDNRVVSMCVVEPGRLVLAISENGFGKRTDPEEFREQGRGGQGVTAMNLTDKTGPLAAQLMVSEEEDIILITNDGTIIRMAANTVRACGRATQGVRMMRVAEGSRVVAVTCAYKEEEQADESAEVAEPTAEETNEETNEE